MDVLSFVIDKYPEARSICDADGKLPIHYACELEGITNKVIDRILNAYPEGAYAIDVFGYSPIHYASANPDMITKEAALIALGESKVCQQALTRVTKKMKGLSSATSKHVDSRTFF